MKNILIIHDTDELKSRRKREDNWYEWLKGEVGIDEEADDAANKGKEYKFFLQEMPLSWKPNLDLYWNFLKEKFNFNKDSIVIGHGSGAAALIGILEKVPNIKSVNKVVLVSPFIESEKKEYKKLFKKDLDWEEVKKKANEFYVFYSDKDEEVDPERSKKIAEKLGADEKELKGKGHFEDDELPELLDIIS